MMIRRRFRTLCRCIRNVVLSLVLSLILIVYAPGWLNRNSILNDLSANALEFIRYKEIPAQKLNSIEVRNVISKNNQAETILNVDKFGHIKNETTILVVQVQKYRDTFKYLLASLCDVVGIQETLIIFSHSYVDENVNKLIQNIDFCRVLQIFYPHSLQAFPREFPGYSENDCPHDMTIEKAEFVNCTGASNPDIHGKYRQPEKAANKHFWWWTANKIFQNLSSTVGHTGIVIFLEDDLYIMEDFLYMILYMKKLAKSLPQCEIISIGTDPAMYDDAYNVEFSTWDPRRHSGVLGLDSSVWASIAAHFDVFCSIDDSSWSRSLFYISLNRRENKRFKAVYSTIPRAIKTSTCIGALGGCEIIANVIRALTITKSLKGNLFPPFLQVYTHIELDDDEYVVFDIIEGEGGWSDPRDVALCGNMTFDKVKKLLLDMEIQFKDYSII